MALALRGIFGPVVTNFDHNEELDLAAFTANLRAHMDAGMDGVVVAGSTGEAALLDESERSRIIEAARAVVPPDRLVIAGTGAESTRSCAKRCREAAARGADAVLVVSPHYYTSSMSTQALAGHFTRVADESPVPVLLYNIPKYAHFRIEPELVGRLSEHRNIIGMKDSAGDLACLAEYLRAQDDTFSVFTGHGGTWAQALRLGVRGGILAVALFAFELAADVWQAHNEERYSDAEAMQRRLTPLAAEIVARMGVPGVKRAMERVGLHGGPVRLPLLPLPASDVEKLPSLLKESAIAV